MSRIDYVSYPVDGIHGEITVPGDKSISHRSILFGSIADGLTEVSGFLQGEDCLATLRAFRSMGVRIDGPSENGLTIHGVGKYGLYAPNQAIDCGNSGTSMRLLSGLLPAQSFDAVLTGDESLLQRPMLRVSKPLTLMGAHIKTTDGKPPVYIYPVPNLKGIEYVLPEPSAQVKSCLLLAGMYASGRTTVVEVDRSRDHTERMLKTFGYPIEINGQSISIESNGSCKSTKICIPGDISSAAFFIVAATIIPGSEIYIQNVGINPTRFGVIQILRSMGAQIEILDKRNYGEEPVANLYIKHTKLKGIVIDESLISSAIDEFPILFIAAACAEGVTILRNAKELRVKETDRIAAMAEGLNRLGIYTETYEDGIMVKGGTLQGGEVFSFGDHRIAMSFSIAGAVSRKPVRVKNCQNVSTSFPSFVQTAKALSLNIQEVI